ncbi:MAG TPA: hypothetical protein VFV75_12650 [Candidatus Polarisedimenticolaceae bacterium]|nr:hypothetical protein [Candidatus Polarisedimenticolaceae bacterium]
MRGTISFHPVDPALFEGLIAGLLAGRKVQPEPFLVEAVRVRAPWIVSRRTVATIEQAFQDAEPPRAAEGASLLERIKVGAVALDHRVDLATARALEVLDPELHLHGRPFFIGEESVERVSAVVHEFRTAQGMAAAEAAVIEQLARLDPSFPAAFPPGDLDDAESDASYRSALLREMRALYDLGSAARRGETWKGGNGTRARTAVAVLPEEAPWRAVCLHARAVPFWQGREVDGLETICRAAKIDPPACLKPAHALFTEVCQEFPGFSEGLPLEIAGERGVGAYVAPSEIDALLDFLTSSGAAMIRAAGKYGEGPACTVLLRKIRECLAYAHKHGLGYLEAAGIPTPDQELPG